MGKCQNSVVVAAPIEKVWAAIRDFHDLAWAPNVVQKVDKVGSKTGDQPGAKRVLNGAFHETLLGVDEFEKTIRYSIDDGPGAVAKDAIKNYVGTVHLFPVTSDNSTFVEWASQYDSADSGAVGELCNPVYQALLKDLAAHFG